MLLVEIFVQINFFRVWTFYFMKNKFKPIFTINNKTYVTLYICK